MVELNFFYYRFDLSESVLFCVSRARSIQREERKSREDVGFWEEKAEHKGKQTHTTTTRYPADCEHFLLSSLPRFFFCFYYSITRRCASLALPLALGFCRSTRTTEMMRLMRTGMYFREICLSLLFFGICSLFCPVAF